MMRPQLATGLEILGVVIGILFLGAVGKVVTPSPSGVHVPHESLSPEQVIADAQSGYQIETCVRSIAPHTVLSNTASGTPEIVVLEGASVTECFPELSQFVTEGRSGGRVGEAASLERRSFGTDISTSVMVLPPSAQVVKEKAPAPALSPSSSSTPIVDSISPSIATSSQVIPPIPAGIPTGGGGGGAPASVEVIPSIDRFDTCRIRLFGDIIPTSITAEENTAFEACLSEIVP